MYDDNVVGLAGGVDGTRRLFSVRSFTACVYIIDYARAMSTHATFLLLEIV